MLERKIMEEKWKYMEQMVSFGQSVQAGKGYKRKKTDRKKMTLRTILPQTNIS